MSLQAQAVTKGLDRHEAEVLVGVSLTGLMQTIGGQGNVWDNLKKRVFMS